MNNVLLRFLSVVFKVFGGGCIIFAFFLTYNVLLPYHTNSPKSYSNMPEFYYLVLSGSFLLPMAAGIISFGVSFLVDVWIALRAIRREIKDLKTTHQI